MTATLADVAKRADVSEATASRVLTGRGYASAATRARVHRAALELDYAPNQAARALSRSRTATVALLVHQAQYPIGGEGTFGARVVHGLTRELRRSNYDLLYVAVDGDAVLDLGRLPAARPDRSDGIVVLGPAFPLEATHSLVARGRPIVLIDNLATDTPVHAVMADNEPAARSLTTHLVVDHGYRRIACLAGPPGWLSTRERVAGYRAAMAAGSLPHRIVHGEETTFREGARLAERVIDDPPEALVAVNDAVALGAMHRLRSEVSQPAVVGFDDIGWAALSDPPLTTVAVDADGMGVAAAVLLLKLMVDPELPPEVVRVPAVPCIRASCGCAPSLEVVP